jgi:hypothetical protein
MAYRPGDATVQIEAEIEVTTAKAWLIKPTMTVKKETWLPKSQCVEFGEPDENNLRLFTVTKWWYDRAELDKEDEDG